MATRSDSSINRRHLVQGGAALSALLALNHVPFSATALAQDSDVEQVLRLTALEPILFDTGTVGGGVGIQLANLLFEGLTDWDWQNKVVQPGAAHSWDVSEDGLVYTFHLNEGMVWTNGDPVTAHDFEFAIKRNLSPEVVSPLASFLYPLVGAEDYFTGVNPDPDSVGITALDDLTVEMTLNASTPFWPVILTVWVTKPIHRASIEAGGDAWTEPDTIITNGRFAMESWEHDQSMVLVRNDTFHGQQPIIERIEYTFFENPTEQGLTAFQTEAIDLAQVSVPNADFVLNDPVLSELIYHQPVSGTWQLRLDMSNANSVISDVNVRKALYLGIDRDLLCSVVLKGFSEPAYVLIPPDIPSYDTSARLEGTIEDARQYLADAGYPNGEGFPGFQLGYAATQENAQLVCEALLQMWNENLGITTASAFAVPTDWRQRIRTEDYDMYFGQWVTDFPDPYMWHNVIFDGDAWQSKWFDEVYLEMIRTANVEPDLDLRNELYKEAEVYRIQDQMATIPIFGSGRVWVVQPWVQNLELSPYDGPLLNINEIQIVAPD